MRTPFNPKPHSLTHSAPAGPIRATNVEALQVFVSRPVVNLGLTILLYWIVPRNVQPTVIQCLPWNTFPVPATSQIFLYPGACSGRVCRSSSLGGTSYCSIHTSAQSPAVVFWFTPLISWCETPSKAMAQPSQGSPALQLRGHMREQSPALQSSSVQLQLRLWGFS